MAKIYVANVEHGDFFGICLDNGRRIIRDFGTGASKVHNEIKDSINRYPWPFGFEKCDAVLTHPHEDHYNGFEDLYKAGYRQLFETAYIPWLDYETKESVHALALKVGLCFLYFLPNSHVKTKSTIKGWIKMAPLMYELSRRLVGVGEGFVFEDWDDKGLVHWPPMCEDVPGNQLMLNYILELFRYEEQRAIVQAFDGVFSELNKVFVAMKSSERHPDSGDGDESEDDSYEKRVENPLGRVNAVLEEMMEARREDTEEKKFDSRLLSFAHNFGQYIDNHSIVFSITEKRDDIKHVALFLSDLYPNAMDEMMSLPSWNISFVDFLKSAHHGTRLGNCLKSGISANTIVHCCGKGKGGKKAPNPDYQVIVNGRVSRIICTNWKQSGIWGINPGYSITYPRKWSSFQL